MIKDIMTGVYTYKGNDINFEFCTNLTASEKLRFVKSVSNIIVDEDYNYIIRDLMFDFYIINFFTDIDTYDIKHSDNSIDEIEELLDNTNILDIIKANVDSNLIDELNKAVDVDIEYKTGIHKNTLNDALSELVHTLERKINEIDLNSAMEMAQSFSKITDDFTVENIVKAYTDMNIVNKDKNDSKALNKKTEKFVKEMSKSIDIKNKK